MNRKEEWLTLNEAIRRRKKHFPNLPLPAAAIRRAVVEGVLPARRSSKRKGARYYVDWEIFVKYLADLYV